MSMRSRRSTSNSALKLASTFSRKTKWLQKSRLSFSNVARRLRLRTMVSITISCMTHLSTMATRITTACSGQALYRMRRFSTRFRTFPTKTFSRSTKSIISRTSTRITCSQKCLPSRISTWQGWSRARTWSNLGKPWLRKRISEDVSLSSSRMTALWRTIHVSQPVWMLLQPKAINKKRTAWQSSDPPSSLKKSRLLNKLLLTLSRSRVRRRKLLVGAASRTKLQMSEFRQRAPRRSS